MNTVHLHETWMPSYYVAVDSRVMREFGAEIVRKFNDIPKFIPSPQLDGWKGENFYRFYHRPGPLFPHNGKKLDRGELLEEEGISFGNVMHVAIQIAAWMGFQTLLMIGVQHKPFKAQEHFWGCDHGMSATPPVADWFEGYSQLSARLKAEGITLLNISEDTYVPEEILPRGDWRQHVSN